MVWSAVDNLADSEDATARVHVEFSENHPFLLLRFPGRGTAENSQNSILFTSLKEGSGNLGPLLHQEDPYFQSTSFERYAPRSGRPVFSHLSHCEFLSRSPCSGG
jgi:hypothetical protein